VVGFLPYWEVGGFTPDYTALTTLVYWSVNLEASGSISRSGQGFTTLTSDALSSDTAQAHAARDRVLLTVFSENASVINSVSKHPSSAGRRLADSLAPLLSAGAFDGVDLDIEGDSTADRPGFVKFVAVFARALGTLGPNWSTMLDAYPTSAFDPLGFFDVKALMRYVDELFVMAYDMQDPGIASATAPLTNADLNDAATLAQYASVVPASRIILGIPLYGYDFPASNRYDGATATGNPVAVTYSQIVAAGRPSVWDPLTETPYTVFRRNNSWHQTWFDDPVSIALKSALAARFGCAGVGVWELGMAGDNASVTAALLGGSAPVKLPLVVKRPAVAP
jgi:spore germination protein YaaH